MSNNAEKIASLQDIITLPMIQGYCNTANGNKDGAHSAAEPRQHNIACVCLDINLNLSTFRHSFEGHEVCGYLVNLVMGLVPLSMQLFLPLLRRGILRLSMAAVMTN